MGDERIRERSAICNMSPTSHSGGLAVKCGGICCFGQTGGGVGVQIQVLLQLQDGDIMTITYDTYLTNLLVVVWMVGDLYNIDKLWCEACFSIQIEIVVSNPYI